MFGDNLIPFPMQDWQAYRAAALALLAGQNPYHAGWGIFRLLYPPWALILILPYLLLSHDAAFFAMSITSTVVLGLVARRFKLGTLGTFFLISTPTHLYALGYGNVVWLPWIGLLFPAPIALIFLSTKPHVTLVVILIILMREWDRAGLYGVIIAAAPTAVLTMIWLILWGFPDLGGENIGNVTFFPWSLLLGVPALILAMRHRSTRLAAFANPFLMPYTTFYGYLGTAFAFPFWAWLVSFLPVVFYR